VSFVLDNSVATRWRFENAAHPYADGILNRLAAGEDALVPVLIQIPQNLQPRKLALARQPNRYPKHPPIIPREVSSVTGTGVTF
jgi:hypothetical protein